MNNYYKDSYLPKVNKIGKLTGLIGCILAFSPAIALALFFNIYPNWAALGTAFIAGASAFGVLWVVEPISYYPVVGTAGTYMAFLSGNISNMRVPCASVAQVAAGVEPGTDQGSIIATLGMAVSVLVNLVVLTIGALLGTTVLSALPPEVTSALGYLLPALFGALMVQFGSKMKRHSVIMLIIAIIIYYMIGMGYFKFIKGSEHWIGTLSCVFISIGIGLATFKNNK